ncbi:putative structural maintenance of chromosomes protein [Cryptosporidium serpentis]
MYIKEVRIKGFKTYRDETVITFDPGCNCIVGLNGSGKSNILAAIQFLFSDTIGNVPAERKALLHEGVSSAVSEASIEILLDNTSRRLSMYDENIVSLKRVFNSACQKEEWIIAGKHISKKDFESVLESCGISRSNPYFIVRQGKVTELATMSDAARLRLLREIAGTRTYDERREESMRLLLETGTRKTRVDTVFSDIQKRIETLKEEQKEFRAYVNLDKRKRALEYLLIESEWEEASKAEQEYFEKLERAEKNLGTVDEEYLMIEIKKTKEEELRKILEGEISALKAEKKHIQNKIVEASGAVKKLELEITEYEKNCKSTVLTQEKESKKVIEELEAEVARKRKSLGLIKESYNNMIKEKEILQQQESFLLSKQLEQSYSNIEERNNALQNKLNQHKRSQKQLEEHLFTIRSSLEVKNKELESLDKNLKKWQKLEKKSQEELDSIAIELHKINEEKHSIIEEKHRVEKMLFNINNKLKLLSTTIMEKEKSLEKHIKPSIRKGISLIHEYCKAENFPWGFVNSSSNEDLPLICGTLLENINVDDIYAIAVEAAAGRNLHNIIVKNQEVAAKIIAYLNSNRSKDESIDYSLILSPVEEISKMNFGKNRKNLDGIDGAIKMIDVLSFDERLRGTIEQVFGKFAIVENFEVAKKVVEIYNMSCVTLDGDEWDNKGCIRGGYRYNLESENLFTQSEELNTLLKERDSLIKEKDAAESNFCSLEESINNIERKKEQILYSKEQVSSDISKATEMIHLTESRMRNIESTINKISQEEEKLVANLDINQGYITEICKEMSSKTLSKGLNYKEELKLKKLINSLRELNHEKFPPIEEEVHRLTNSLEESEIRLNSLLQEYYQLQEETNERNQNRSFSTENLSDIKSTLREEKSKLKRLNERIDEISDRIKKVDDEIKLCEDKQEKFRTTESNLLDQQKQLQGEVERLKNKYEHYRHMKSIAIQEKVCLGRPDNLSFTINDLPSTKVAIFEELEKVKKQLNAEFHTVNKKVISELDHFIREYTDLSERHNELNTAMTSIQTLVETLDIQKEKTLLKIFEEINFYFNQVFKELIPNGDAKLVLKVSSQDKLENSNQSNINLSSDRQASQKKTQKNLSGLKNVDNSSESTFIGIGMRVSFQGVPNSSPRISNGSNLAQNKTSNYYSLNQLSGGQKTLVALALLFAVHRADPAPLYLLDEIDAALDDQYRLSVATLIQKQALSTQFIITTFRPQFIDIADKFFQVSQVNRSSLVKEINKQQALELLQEQLQQQKMLAITEG